MKETGAAMLRAFCERTPEAPAALHQPPHANAARLNHAEMPRPILARSNKPRELFPGFGGGGRKRYPKEDDAARVT